MFKHTAQLVVVLCLAFLAASPAQGGGSRAGSCGVTSFSYAGLQSDSKAHGVAATLVPTRAPNVYDGHVAGWVGVSGTNGGSGGVAEWIQVGFTAISGPTSQVTRMYYEVTVAGSTPQYVELDADVKPGDAHRVAVLELSNRNAWWRVLVDGRAVSPPIHLPGSHGAWFPQAVGENYAGGSGSCNVYAYRFTDVALAHANGGDWQPLKATSLFEDRGYKVVETSMAPRSFVAASL